MVGSVVLLGLLAWKVDLAEAWRLLVRADATLTVVLITLFALGNAYNGFRWWVILRLGAQPVPLWPVVRVTLWSSLVGMFLPGLVGVELIRFTVMARYTKNPAMVFCSVMVDRLLGLIALFLLVLVGCSLSPLPLDPATQWLAIGCIGLVTLGVTLMFVERFQALMRRVVPSRLVPMIGARMDKVFSGIRLYRDVGHALWGSLGLAIVTQVIRVVAVIIADRALGIGLHPILYFVIVPVSMFLEMLPISLLGLGVREVSMVAFFGLVGQPTESGLALSLFVFIAFTISRLPGVGAFLMEKDDVSAQILANARSRGR